MCTSTASSPAGATCPPGQISGSKSCQSALGWCTGHPGALACLFVHQPHIGVIIGLHHTQDNCGQPLHQGSRQQQECLSSWPPPCGHWLQAQGCASRAGGLPIAAPTQLLVAAAPPRLVHVPQLCAVAHSCGGWHAVDCRQGACRLGWWSKRSSQWDRGCANATSSGRSQQMAAIGSNSGRRQKLKCSAALERTVRLLAAE